MVYYPIGNADKLGNTKQGSQYLYCMDHFQALQQHYVRIWKSDDIAESAFPLHHTQTHIMGWAFTICLQLTLSHPSSSVEHKVLE